MQGSDWKNSRLGFVTASRFADVLTEPRAKSAKEAGELSQTALAYLHQLIGDHLSGFPAPELDTFATRWGREHEAEAREAFSWRVGINVTECGFFAHPTESWIGGTPDGLVGDDATLEIKCPFTRAAHIAVLRSGQIPDEYVSQVHGEMWVTGRPRAYFVSYHPDFQAPHNLAIVEVGPMSHEWAERVCRFRDRLVSAVQELISGK